ncbi:MAG: viperin family antiviral radical SAM protein [Bacteroidales bacterium]
MDWVAISIDSLNCETNLRMGRAIAGKKPLALEYYKSVVSKVKDCGYGLKINTVVNSHNLKEDMIEFIQFSKPKRWKILQALPIKGQNDKWISEMTVTDMQFDDFIKRHQAASESTTMVPESNSEMKGSYVMVDPAGRFFDNTQGFHRYSRPILEIGVEEAFKEVEYDNQKFKSRGGIYEWMVIR